MKDLSLKFRDYVNRYHSDIRKNIDVYKEHNNEVISVNDVKVIEFRHEPERNLISFYNLSKENKCAGFLDNIFRNFCDFYKINVNSKYSQLSENRCIFIGDVIEVNKTHGKISIKRDSGFCDVLNFIIKKEFKDIVKVGSKIYINGSIIVSSSVLSLTKEYYISPKYIWNVDDLDLYINCCNIKGVIVNDIIRRKTSKTNKDISDLCVVNFKNNYIWSLLWGKDIKEFDRRKLSKGDDIILSGRWESRSYEKVDEIKNAIEEKSICELSVYKIS